MLFFLLFEEPINKKWLFFMVLIGLSKAIYCEPTSWGHRWGGIYEKEKGEARG